MRPRGIHSPPITGIPHTAVHYYPGLTSHWNHHRDKDPNYLQCSLSFSLSAPDHCTYVTVEGVLRTPARVEQFSLGSKGRGEKVAVLRIPINAPQGFLINAHYLRKSYLVGQWQLKKCRLRLQDRWRRSWHCLTSCLDSATARRTSGMPQQARKRKGKPSCLCFECQICVG